MFICICACAFVCGSLFLAYYLLLCDWILKMAICLSQSHSREIDLSLEKLIIDPTNRTPERPDCPDLILNVYAHIVGT
jgi:hypothetical protein